VSLCAPCGKGFFLTTEDPEKQRADLLHRPLGPFKVHMALPETGAGDLDRRDEFYYAFFSANS
jgi:hypothetical protein